MAKLIPITQNPQRYTQRDNEWVISASPNVTPLTIQKGISIAGLKPLLEVDGVIVKADEWYLCSQATLNALRDSNNPHYAIEGNGPVSVKGKSVTIGKTIRMLEIDVDKLKDEAEALDFQNRKAAVAYVDYIFEGDTQDGIPINLIRQINYTLNPNISRPADKYGLHSLQLGDDETVYSITQLNTETKQSDGTLDKGKLETFLKNLQNRLIVLRSDFNMIKDVFYNGTFPDTIVTIDLEGVAVPGVSEGPESEPPVTFKYTQLAAVVESTVSTPASGSTTTGGTSSSTSGETPPPPPEGAPAQPPLPPVIQLRMRKKRDLKANRIGVYEGDPTAGGRGALKRIIKEGDTFWGYFFKDWEHGQKIWAVYEADKTTLIGYGIADKNDFVDPI
jgi:hypothetical protein